MLHVEGIRVTIRGFTILRGVNLDIATGGLAGLVGRNGAGKTTTLKSIIGIMPVSAGSIKLDDDDLLQIPAHRRARMGMGYMPEERRLIPALSVHDNIMTPAWACNLEAEKSDERMDYICRLMPDLRAWADRKATELSGGQQKMVALGRALMSGTKVLLLDEPFEGLAPRLGDLLGKIIKDIQQEGLSILIAESDSKRLGFVQDMFTIERGEIVQNGDQNAEGQ